MVKGAVLYNFNEPLKIESVTLKAPREDEVVVKLAASGVCHSDLSVMQAKLPFPPPVMLGHEGAGIVEEVGKGVTDLKPGDHVVLSWVQNCGTCHYCVARPRPPLRQRRTRGDGRAGVRLREGRHAVSPAWPAWRRSPSAPSCAPRAAIKIPNDVPLDKACLVGCGVMTGVGAAINTAKVRPGQTVAVFGCGGVGLNVIQGAALCGASRIIAVDLVGQEAAAGEAVRRHRRRQRQGRRRRRRTPSARSPTASASTTPSR